MILYPAIDLLGGKVVRLRQGEYDDSTVYGDDPVSVAQSFVNQGASWVHMVDLDAGRARQFRQAEMADRAEARGPLADLSRPLPGVGDKVLECPQRKPVGRPAGLPAD